MKFGGRKFILLSQVRNGDLFEIGGEESTSTNRAGSSTERLGSRSINEVGYAFVPTLLGHSFKKKNCRQDYEWEGQDLTFL